MLVDRYLSSISSRGDLTLLNLAQQIYGAINSIAGKVIVSTMVPVLAKVYQEGKKENYIRIFYRRLFISFLVSILTVICLLFFGKWVLGLLFVVKKFSAENVDRLWWLLVALTGFFAGGIMGSVVSSAFYSKGDTVTPTRIGLSCLPCTYL